MKELLNQEKLHNSGVVANNRMNRGRGAAGANSYQKDLSLNPVEFLLERLINRNSAAWLDICCGEGRALIETAMFFADRAQTARPSRSVRLVGIDLAGFFEPFPSDLTCLSLLETPIENFEPSQKFDLITAVHGLHYIGDKLSVIQKAAGWLKSDGVFSANLEISNLRLVQKANSDRIFSDFFRKRGFKINRRKHLLTLHGALNFDLPFEYLGADDKAGPNHTGQPVVNSYYKF